jgi:ADP-ribose pyrophosphatase YjhB (NUDIX family)
LHASRPKCQATAADGADRRVSHLLSATTPLRAADAVAALLVVDDGRYLLQRRDDEPTIWYPGHWGLFGGAVEEGEAPLDALRRELQEELELAPSAIEWFTRFDFDLGTFGQGRLYRIFYLVPLATAELRRLRLHEGAGMQAFAPTEIFGAMKVTPYDAFAIWLHFAQKRLRVG